MDVEIQISTVAPTSPDEVFRDIANLFHDHAGKLYVTERSLIAITIFGVVFTARLYGRLVGALTVTYCTPMQIIAYNLDLDADKQLDPAVPTFEVCDAVVRHEHRNNGIMTSLLSATTDLLWYGEPPQPIPRAITVSRVPVDGDGPSSFGLLTRLKWREAGRVPCYLADLDATEFRCPSCCQDGTYRDGSYHTCGCLGATMVWKRGEP